MRDGTLSSHPSEQRHYPDRATRIMLARFVVYAMVSVAGTAGHYACLLCATFGINSAWTFRATAAL
jgi:hypothetical protein